MYYHFSEEKNIDVFIPREKQNTSIYSAFVWAIDEEHEPSYYFPRDCPRIVLRRHEATTDEHIRQFFNHTDAHTIITVESDWYTAIAKQTMYRYHFNDDGFELYDKTAGYYISPHTVTPICVDIYDHLIERLLKKGIELRFTSNLYPLREAILASDFLGFGIHRFRNARKP